MHPGLLSPFPEAPGLGYIEVTWFPELPSHMASCGPSSEQRQGPL